MKIAAFFGFSAFFCFAVAALNIRENPFTAFAFLTAAVLFFGFSSFCYYEAGRRKERGRVLTEKDLEDNNLYKIVQVFDLNENHRPYRSVAMIMNFETKEERIYKLRLVPHPLMGICHGRHLKNLAGLNEAVEKEAVAKRL